MTEADTDGKKVSFDVTNEDNSDENSREAWGSPWEFFLSCLGYAIGFGNVWRFPFLCYKNGGAAFLIPYGIMLIIAGIPLFFMELVLGQYASLGPSVLFGNMAPILTGLGYAMLMISFLITIYYNLIFAWAIFYFIASFTSVVPWSHCRNDFNSPGCFTPEESIKCVEQNLTFYNRSCVETSMLCEMEKLGAYNETHCYQCDSGDCLETDILGANGTLIELKKVIRRVSPAEDYYKNRVLGVTGKSWEDMGSMRWEMVGCLFIGWAVICLCLIRGIKSSGKVVYVTSTFPYLIMLILFIRGITLEGAYQGLEFYLLKPNWSKMTEIEVWNDAATQIFYSLGSSAGVLITLSSYNKLKNNCLRDALVVALANSSTSIFAGLVIFSVLGFMANELNVPVAEVVSSGSGLAFVAYPGALAAMPVPWLWSILFFSMLMSLGISSQFSYVETLSSSIFDQFEGLRPHKPKIMVLMIFFLFVCGLTMCLEGGAYMIELFVWYSSGISLITIGLIEILCIQYIFGFKNVMKIIEKDMEIKMPRILYGYWSITWLFITPASLTVICAISIYYFVPAYYDGYLFPEKIQTLGWLMCCSSIILIPLGALWAIFKKDSMTWKELFQPTEDMCTGDERRKRQKQMTERHSYTYHNHGFTSDTQKEPASS